MICMDPSFCVVGSCELYVKTVFLIEEIFGLGKCNHSFIRLVLHFVRFRWYKKCVITVNMRYIFDWSVMIYKNYGSISYIFNLGCKNEWFITVYMMHD